MINKLSIRNFQSHKDTEVEFCDGINTILGESNRGKTAMLRALYWVFFNRPDGFAFASHWIRDPDNNKSLMKPVSVKIELDSKKIIERKRTDAFNGYIMDENEEQPFKALRTNVPEEIQDALNINEGNIQKQMDAPFLLSDTAGGVARFFNKTINLDIIDYLLLQVDRLKRETKAKMNDVVADKESVVKQVEELSWADRASFFLRKAENIDVELKEFGSEYASISDLINDFVEYDQIINLLDFDALSDEIERASSLFSLIRENEKGFVNLKFLISEYSSLTAVIEANTAILEIVDSRLLLVEELEETLSALEEDYSDLCVLISDYNQVDTDLSLYGKYEGIRVLEKQADELELKVREQESRLAILVECIDSFNTSDSSIGVLNKQIETTENLLPDNCPLCGAYRKETVKGIEYEEK
jgi:DNA repair ATPase RecN